MIPPRDLTLTLSEAEVRLVQYVGRRRAEGNRAAGVRDRRYDAGGVGVMSSFMTPTFTHSIAPGGTAGGVVTAAAIATATFVALLAWVRATRRAPEVPR